MTDPYRDAPQVPPPRYAKWALRLGLTYTLVATITLLCVVTVRECQADTYRQQQKLQRDQSTGPCRDYVLGEDGVCAHRGHRLGAEGKDYVCRCSEEVKKQCQQ